MSTADEIIITSDSSGQMFSAAGWDPQTGTQLATYKNGASLGYNTLNIVAESYLLAADNTKPRLYFWPLNKQTPVENTRFVVPGNVTALTCSPDGLYIVAAIGEKLCIWQTSSGALLAVVSKHYQAVTCLKFTSDGSTLVSAGGDGLVFVWSFSRVVSKTENNSEACQAAPIYSFSDHSLAVKDVFVGRFGIQARMVTVSLDSTARIYDLDSGSLLLTLVFGVPLTTACMDLVENYLFVGSTTGDILHFDLRSPPRGREHHVNQKEEESAVFKGHTKAVTCLSVSTDCGSLLSGSADGSVNIWHIASRQIVRTIPHKGPVTSAFFTRAVNAFFTNELRPKILLHSMQRTAGDNENEVIEVVNLRGAEDFLKPETFFDGSSNASDINSHSYAELQKARDEIKALKAINSEIYKFGVKYLMK